MKTVLFVCVENSCRSQMDEGLLRQMAVDRFQAYSAGSRPSGQVNPVAVEVMKEAGIDISRQASKGFDDLSVKKFDYVVTLGCKDRCPFVPAAQHIDWTIDDPKGKGIESFRRTRDQIRQNIRSLIK